MMDSRSARAHVRRSAIVAASGALRITGQSSRMWQQKHGLAVLLVHNTPPHLADRLMEHVTAHRQRYTNFTDVEDRGLTSSRLALTFDDGFKSNLNIARRLHDVGVQSCFYVPTDVVGLDQADVDAFFRSPQAEGVLTWDDLEEIVALGHVVGSHCREHKPLIDQSDAQAEDQIKGSLAVLSERLGSARHFAWPFGSLRHADPDKVVAWCADVDALPASGVRGFNSPHRFEREGYLRRDAVDLNWIEADVSTFLVRDAHRRG